MPLSKYELDDRKSAAGRVKSLAAYLPVFYEFFRYALVGGSAFLIDIGFLYLTRTFLFQHLETVGILLAAACGFAAGLIYNYLLSVIFVFKTIDENANRHKIRSFIIFTAIGVIGLGLTELLMYGGVRLFGQRRYLVVKIVTAGIVLLWNYIARKIFIFKGARLER